MTFCKIYCNDPPTTVDNCETLRPQLIRISANSRKTIRFRMFNTCYDTPVPQKHKSDTKPVYISWEQEDPFARVINIPNRFSLNTRWEKPGYNNIYWKIVNADGEVIYEDVTKIKLNNLFSIDVPALDVSEGYYKMIITRNNRYIDSSCLIKMFICR